MLYSKQTNKKLAAECWWRSKSLIHVYCEGV